MVNCCIPVCNNTARNCKARGEVIRFYTVPKDLNLQQTWMAACGIVALQVDTRVCSAHFKQTDLFAGSKRGKLSPTAIPEVNCVQSAPSHLYTKSQRTPIPENEILKLRVKRRNETIKKLTMKIRTEQAKNKKLNDTIRQLKLQMALRTLRLEDKVSRTKEATMKISESNRQICSRFTASQVRVITKGLSKTWWAEEDICKALCLRAKSLRAYEFVRDVYKIPLPSVSTLQRWMKEIRFDPGIIFPVLNLLKVEFANAAMLERQCAIVFDEMNLEANVSYDAAADRIYGPHKKMLVVFVRGLFSPWKQPIYFGYDENLDPSKIKEVISNLHAVGLDVRTMTCDNAGGNRGIWTKLNVTYDNPKFEHSITGTSVFCVSDPPHLIKLFRNNLMDYGFTLKDGTIIQKQDFQCVLKIDRKEFRSCHKLTSKHIDVVKSDRQNVRMAFETISASVAEGFRSYLPNRQRQAEFLQLANDAFDVLNSRVTNNQNPLKCSFGVFLSQQVAVLDNFFEEIDGLKVMCGRPIKHFPFQKGIMMTINSLKEVYTSLQAELNIDYVSVNRLNQDIGENGFGVMRGMGGFKQNPHSVDAKYRLRMLSIGWHLLKPSRHSSVEEEDENDNVFGQRLLPLMECKGPPIPPISEEVEAAISEIRDLEIELDETNYQDFCESLGPSEKAEFGGMEFLSGYVVRKLKSKFPEHHLQDEESEGRDCWTKRVSLGNLTIPSLAFVNLVRKWEFYFEAYHGEDPTSTFRFKLNRNFGVMSQLAARIHADFTDIPEELIKYYVKVRTCIRIKDVNEKLKQWRVSQRNLRKAAQFACSAFPNEDGDSNSDLES